MKQVVDRNQKVKTEVCDFMDNKEAQDLTRDTIKEEEKKGKKASKQQVIQVKVQSKI